jgi:hypothetical protein
VFGQVDVFLSVVGYHISLILGLVATTGMGACHPYDLVLVPDVVKPTRARRKRRITIGASIRIYSTSFLCCMRHRDVHRHSRLFLGRFSAPVTCVFAIRIFRYLERKLFNGLPHPYRDNLDAKLGIHIRSIGLV